MNLQGKAMHVPVGSQKARFAEGVAYPDPVFLREEGRENMVGEAQTAELFYGTEHPQQYGQVPACDAVMHSEKICKISFWQCVHIMKNKLL